MYDFWRQTQSFNCSCSVPTLTSPGEDKKKAFKCLLTGFPRPSLRKERNGKRMLLDSRDTSLISVQPLSRQCSGDVPSSLHPITMRQRRRTLKPESLNPRFRDPFHPQTQTLWHLQMNALRITVTCADFTPRPNIWAFWCRTASPDNTLTFFGYRCCLLLGYYCEVSGYLTFLFPTKSKPSGVNLKCGWKRE